MLSFFITSNWNLNFLPTLFNFLSPKLSSYILEISGSTFDITISRISIVELKNGQFLSISWSVFLNFLIEEYLKASAVPSQAGNINLIWVQAKTHGIALKLSISCEVFLFDGLDPIDNFPSEICGVTVLK